MKLFLFFLFVIMMACNKNKSNMPPLQGLWVENSLRLDSIEFSDDFSTSTEKKFSMYLKSQPYIDVSQNPDHLITHSSIYSYYLEGEYMFLHSFYSSSSMYNNYGFELSDNKKSFTIKRFYTRNSLPAFIEFVRIE